MKKTTQLYINTVFISFILLKFCSQSFAIVTVLDKHYTAEIYATYPANENPRSLVFDNDANLYCTQTIAGTIRKIIPDRSSTDFVTNLNLPKGIVWAGGTAYGDFFYVTTSEGMVRIGLDRSITKNWCVDSDGLHIPVIDITGSYDNLMYATTIGSYPNNSSFTIKTISSAGISSVRFGLYYAPTPYWHPQALTIATKNFGEKMFVGQSCTYKPKCKGHPGIYIARTHARFTNLGDTYSLAIDKTGYFGCDMFAKSRGLLLANNDSVGIWRVNPDGTTEKFADMNDASPGDVIFGPDGAMYVSELENNDTVNIIRIFGTNPPIYVDDDAPYDNEPNIPDPIRGGPKSDLNENGSWSHPFDSIQKAIDSSNKNDLIIVKDGIYSGIGNYKIDTKGLVVTISSENGCEYTIIDCNNLGQAFVFTNHEEPNTVIDGFTITAGTSPDFGGAIECDSSSPTIKNCRLFNNYAAWSGGAIFIGPDSNAVISNCEIYDNNAEASSGGAIFSYYSSPKIKNCVIAQNFAYFNGGISSNDYSDSIIENCTIADNFAESDRAVGGVKCMLYSHTKVLNSIIWNNYGKQISTSNGATIEVIYSDVEMVDSNGIWAPDRRFPGQGNINLDPLFAEPYFDYHLKSKYGRWIPYAHCNGDFNADGIVNYIDYSKLALCWMRYNFKWLLYGNPKYKRVDYNYIRFLSQNWLEPGINTEGKEFIKDGVTSPCIDAGNPDSDYSLEPLPNGNRINMDAYGNTFQASKSPDDAPIDPNT